MNCPLAAASFAEYPGKQLTDVENGPLFIISGPSGCGKSTLVRRLLELEGARLHLSVSATTRPPREGEINGKDYHFWTLQQFEEAIIDGSLLEHAQVFAHWYGTPRCEVDAFIAKGVGVLLEIDVQGAEQVRRKVPDAVSVFLKAPSLEDYEQRLRMRQKDSEEVIQRRLAGAATEEARAGEFTEQVVNDNLDRAVREVRSIIHRSFMRTQNA